MPLWSPVVRTRNVLVIVKEVIIAATTSQPPLLVAHGWEGLVLEIGEGTSQTPEVDSKLERI